MKHTSRITIRVGTVVHISCFIPSIRAVDRKCGVKDKNVRSFPVCRYDAVLIPINEKIQFVKEMSNVLS